MKLLMICAAVLIATSMTGCAKWTGEGTATEAARCEIWGKSLPTRSRSDTAQTKEEISRAYAAFEMTCPSWDYLMPR